MRFLRTSFPTSPDITTYVDVHGTSWDETSPEAAEAYLSTYLAEHRVQRQQYRDDRRAAHSTRRANRKPAFFAASFVSDSPSSSDCDSDTSRSNRANRGSTTQTQPTVASSSDFARSKPPRKRNSVLTDSDDGDEKNLSAEHKGERVASAPTPTRAKSVISGSEDDKDDQDSSPPSSPHPEWRRADKQSKDK
jgi:hypothetical protein